MQIITILLNLTQYVVEFGGSRMRRTPSFLLALALLLSAASGAQAAPVYKCASNGVTSYQQNPCPTESVKRDPTTAELNAAQKKRNEARTPTSNNEAKAGPTVDIPSHPGLACDGRKYCSQMTSCEEAKYFLAHCPNVHMDGDGNGIPCEKQWCGRR